MYKKLLLIIAAACTLASLPASALPLKILDVNVFVLCNDAGASCASQGPSGNSFFAAETNKIWAQADILVNFSAPTFVNSTQYSDLDENVSTDGMDNLFGFINTTGNAVDMYLVHSIEEGTGTLYGAAVYAWNAAFIAMDDVMAYDSGAGRKDTIAHELGHLLGLLQPADGGDAGWHSAVANHLMASGGIRLIPSSLANIAPDGAGYDLLPSDQITIARSNSRLRDAPTASVPEPGVLVLIALGLAGLGLARRRVALN